MILNVLIPNPEDRIMCVKVGKVKRENLGSVRKASCIHAHSFISLNRKNGMSETPLN